MRYYTKEHLWLDYDAGKVRFGLTGYAVSMLREITYFEFSSDCGEIEQGTPVAFLESVKIAQEIAAPVSGKLDMINEILTHNIHDLNHSPEGSGWLGLISVDEFVTDDYLTSEEYQSFIRRG